MSRVVVLGNGASGKSRFARDLAAATGIEAVELDKIFWSAELAPPPVADWRALQDRLTVGERWILDGDLGPYEGTGRRSFELSAIMHRTPCSSSSTTGKNASVP